MTPRHFAVVISCLLAVACSDSEGSSSDGSGGGTAGAGPGSGAGGSAGGPATCHDAQEPFGADDNFPDLSFDDCDGVEQSLKALRCQNSITLLSIGAGWCMPCREETPDFQAAYEAHRDEGLGVVQVMFQDNSSNAATTLFCQDWVDEFMVTFPVLIDPVNNTMQYFEQTQAPLNVLMDRDGKVLFSQVGKIDNVEALVTQYLPQ